jgi:hypothetical protein
MQRFIPWVGALACVSWIGLGASFEFAGESAAAAREPAEVASSAKTAEAAILKALEEKTVVEFVETPLQDAFEYLQKKHKIEIQLDKKALDDAGLGTDTPMTRSLKDVSLRAALRLLLKEYDLTFVIDNEVLLITTIDEAGQKLVMKDCSTHDLGRSRRPRVDVCAASDAGCFADRRSARADHRAAGRAAPCP